MKKHVWVLAAVAVFMSACSTIQSHVVDPSERGVPSGSGLSGRTSEVSFSSATRTSPAFADGSRAQLRPIHEQQSRTRVDVRHQR